MNKKYHILVLFERGSHGFTFERSPNVSIHSLLAEHEQKTKDLNNTDWARTFSLVEIMKDDEGNVLRDENGNLIEELRYIDEEIIKAMRGY